MALFINSAFQFFSYFEVFRIGVRDGEKRDHDFLLDLILKEVLVKAASGTNSRQPF